MELYDFIKGLNFFKIKVTIIESSKFLTNNFHNLKKHCLNSLFIFDLCFLKYVIFHQVKVKDRELINHEDLKNHELALNLQDDYFFYFLIAH